MYHIIFHRKVSHFIHDHRPPDSAIRDLAPYRKSGRCFLFPPNRPWELGYEVALLSERNGSLQDEN
jgi:hypothetical protein